MVLFLFARGRLWRTLALLFLITTALATLATGEHYVVDLVPGMLFGCFAMNAGCRRWKRTMLYGAVVLAWSLAMRFENALMVNWPLLLQGATLLSLVLAGYAVHESWTTVDAPQISRTIATPLPGQA